MVDSYVHYLAVGVANMINIFFPEVVGLSGGVANQGENLLKPLRAAVEPMVFGHEFAKKHTRITTCTLGYRAGVIGAALLAKGQAAQQGVKAVHNISRACHWGGARLFCAKNNGAWMWICAKHPAFFLQCETK